VLVATAEILAGTTGNAAQKPRRPLHEVLVIR
jgi:hypothetical protein